MKQDRWALVGLEPAGRYLLERWCLRGDFPLVAVCDPVAHLLAPACRRNLIVTETLSDLLQTESIAGVILTAAPSARADVLREVRQHRLRLLIAGELGQTHEQGRELAAQTDGDDSAIGVFQVQQGGRDFPAARSSVATGRLGRLRSIRYASCEYAGPVSAEETSEMSGWRGTLIRSGPVVFDQLLCLAKELPQEVRAWADHGTAGFQARIEFSGNLTAWIDVQRASLNGLRTGWVLEGTNGAYRGGRLFSLASDGELIEEDVALADADDDVISELRRLASDAEAARQSVSRSLQRLSLLEAIERSVLTNASVEVTS